MPRFFIDTNDGDYYVRDEEGQELPAEEAAREIALSVLPDMARSTLPDGDRRTFCASVRDERGKTIFKASLDLRAEWLD
ncbi:DUF6894 family protein [Methylobacterium soli]|uniref:DUF6894 domain-containing protein n=1 Tax=Methylobacterium soli TaxID=553447 RepID=A0A6L3SNT3_9HYPH|nr:hypothetical protein [Methylobacterium soli]KAB1070067.1 hypothetical protein F6X53_30530 [Methylobacterium soli]GJE42082.1 hypothetical protein AEGHOMDF_1253 [Methylobacterium soli]